MIKMCIDDEMNVSVNQFKNFLLTEKFDSSKKIINLKTLIYCISYTEKLISRKIANLSPKFIKS